MQLVWVEVKNDESISTHVIDLDVNKARRYLVQDLAYSQVFARIGLVKGVGEVEKATLGWWMKTSYESWVNTPKGAHAPLGRKTITKLSVTHIRNTLEIVCLSKLE